MDWATIATAGGAAIAGASAVYRFLPHLLDRKADSSGLFQFDHMRQVIKDAVTEVFEGRMGGVMEQQTNLLQRVAESQQSTAQSLAVLTALMQQRERGAR